MLLLYTIALVKKFLKNKNKKKKKTKVFEYVVFVLLFHVTKFLAIMNTVSQLVGGGGRSGILRLAGGVNRWQVS